MEPVGLFAVAGLILVKEIGLPIPIPGDLLVVGAGIAAAHGQIDPIVGLVVIVVAGLIGGCIQFLLLRGAARRVLLPLMARVGIGPARLDPATERLRRRGARGVAVARATPGLRIVAIAASALAALPFPVFVTGLVVGNTLFVTGHYLLGMVAGEAALQIVGSVLGTVGLIVIVVVLLAALGAAGWWLLRRRAAGRAGAMAGAGVATRCQPGARSRASLRPMRPIRRARARPAEACAACSRVRRPRPSPGPMRRARPASRSACSPRNRPEPPRVAARPLGTPPSRRSSWR